MAIPQIISLGAGVQSSTMALMAACGELTPMPAMAIFADTQAEPMSVYKWLDWLEKQLPFPTYRVTQGDLADASMRVRKSAKSGKVYQWSGIPLFISKPDGGRGPLQRKCTRDFKITPLLRKVKRLFAAELNEWRKQQRQLKKVGLSGPPIVFQWIGISVDEAHRMKPSREPWVEHKWPLVDKAMTRNDCFVWMAKHGFPRPPRSACVFCPYHSDKEWLRLKTEEPEEFQRAVDFEKRYQETSKQDEVIRGTPFLHDSCRPLAEVNFSKETQPNAFINECEGMCGV